MKFKRNCNYKKVLVILYKVRGKTFISAQISFEFFGGFFGQEKHRGPLIRTHKDSWHHEELGRAEDHYNS